MNHNFVRKKKHHFFLLPTIFVIKKIQKPDHTSKWHPINSRRSYVYCKNIDNFVKKKKGIFQPPKDPKAKIKISETLLFIHRTLQNYSKRWFVYFWKCRRNLRKKVFWRKKKPIIFTIHLTPRTTGEFLKPFYKNIIIKNKIL